MTTEMTRVINKQILVWKFCVSIECEIFVQIQFVVFLRDYLITGKWWNWWNIEGVCLFVYMKRTGYEI